MAKDIEEFLKMAAARRKASQNKTGQTAPADSGPAASAPPPAQQPKRRPPSTARPPRQVVPSEDVDVVRTLRSSSQSRMQSKIDTKHLGEHASQLGETVGLADDKMDEHLHQVFDHKLGSLGEQANDLHSPADQVSQAIVSLQLGQRRNLREAIVLSEILRRPLW